MNKELLSQLKDLSNCRKKVKYRTHIDADLACAELWAIKKRNLCRYKCDWCSGWHLTSAPWDPNYHATKI